MAIGADPWVRTPVEDGVRAFWVPPVLTGRTREVEVRPDEEGRPDLLSWRLWGSAAWWWVFALSDPDRVRDPLRDLVAGAKIRVPERPPSR